jgi:hypothetical protein
MTAAERRRIRRDAVAHLMAGERAIRAPGVTRGPDGRLARNPAGEHDWLRELTPAERKCFASDLLGSDPLLPGADEIATATGHMYVDTWAQELIACWRAAALRPEPAAELTDRPEPIVGPVVGLAEIAELLDVRPATAYQWMRRRRLPEPDVNLAIGPVWWLSTIQGWATETGRL